LLAGKIRRELKASVAARDIVNASAARPACQQLLNDDASSANDFPFFE
jgi:hypothetical protein